LCRGKQNGLEILLEHCICDAVAPHQALKAYINRALSFMDRRSVDALFP